MITHRATLEQGPPIIGGKLVWTSATGITTADPNSLGGCPRKWFYDTVMGKKAPPTKAMQAGTGLHTEIENKLLRGMSLQSPLALAGGMFIPHGGSGLHVEKPIHFATRDGVQIYGHVDLYNLRQQYIDPDGVLQQDPPWSFEVKDWKCLPAGTDVFDVSRGCRRDVSEPGDVSVPTVHSLGWTGAALGAAPARSFASGSKPCVEIRLSDGTVLRASTDHPILTATGWTEAAKLVPTDSVVVAAKMPPPEVQTEASDAEVAFVAYMLSDGGCSGASMRFTNMTPPIVADWLRCASALGYTVRENRSLSKAREFTLSRGGARTPDAVRARWDLHGLAKNKRMHPGLWGLSDAHVALFLNRFWACDGYISHHQISVELASEKLIDDLRFLLLRLGIRSRKCVRTPRGGFTSWVITMGGGEALAFLNAVGDVLGKETACRRVRAALSNIPRRRAKGSAHFISGTALERVVSVEPVGTLPVFDLTVPATGNFVANSIVVHNTTSSFDYAKTERELAENAQLVTYAEAGFRMWPDLEHGRLTHVYFRTRGAPASKLVTIRRSREEIGSRWEYNEGIVRLMVDAAKEQTAERVPANTRSCNAYSGCNHREYCSGYQRSSLDSLYNKIAEDHLAERTPPVGLIAQNQPQLMQAATTQASLAQEEAQMRAQVAQQQQQMSFNPADYLAVCQRLGSYGFGMPSLAGNAAQAYASAGGQMVAPGFVYQGQMAPPGAQASLHGMTLTEVQQVYQIEREAAAKAGVQPATPSFPSTPAPTQTVAVQHRNASDNTIYPTPSLTQQIAQAYAQATAPVPSFLPPGAPESMPQLAQAQPAPEAPPAPAKRGRPKKNDQGTAPETAAALTATQTAAAPPSSSTPAAGVATQVAPAAEPAFPPALLASASRMLGLDAPATNAPPCVVLINARAVSLSTKSLAPYVDYINAELAKRYCVTADGKPCPQDVRCAPKDSVLAFGAWKGAVREVVKADPPPAGDYHLDIGLDELNEVVADALRVVAETKGWLYVRGVRV